MSPESFCGGTRIVASFKIIVIYQTIKSYCTVPNSDGFEGFQVGANYTLAKNIVAQVEWYDLEEKQGDERDAETLWTQVVFTF